MAGPVKRPVVAIIGGGFTGAAIAYHLDQALGHSGAADIVVVEPRESIGPGLAYSTQDPACRINVPASRMSLDPEVPCQFENWLGSARVLHEDPDAVLPDGRKFPRREVFGNYVAEALAPALAVGRVRHHRALVLAVKPFGARHRLSLSDGAQLEADLIVIATTHPPPSVPPTFDRALRGHPRFVADATRPEALRCIGRSDRVLIVGTGLTMADIVASLDAIGYKGKITVFSRRGQLSAPHPPAGADPFGDFLGLPSRTARSLVRRIRSTVSSAEARGLPWQAVFDTLRQQGHGIWSALPLSERQRLVRHLRPFWDARRFRVAPQVHAVIERLRAEERLTVLCGSAENVCVDERGIHVNIRQRGRAGNAHLSVDAVVIATGPSHRNLLDTTPYLASLAEVGQVRPDAVGLGLDTDVSGRAIGANRRISNTVFVGGPLARGTFGELMGLPEVSRHAANVATEIAAQLTASESQISTVLRRQTA